MTWGSGFYQYLLQGQLITCHHWDDIPARPDELISFIPEIPPGPHTAAQHDQINTLPATFQEYLQRCQRSQE